jgi:cell division protein FtsW
MKHLELKIRYDYWLELVTLTLMAIGTVFVFSAGANVSGQYDWKRFYEFTTLKQLLFFPAAVGIMYLVSYFDYRRFGFIKKNPLKSLTPYLVILSILLLVVVLVFGEERNYSKRWLFITLGPINLSFQPSELAKWVMIIFLAAIMDRCHDDLNKFFTRFVPICIVPTAVAALIITQDFGTAAYIALMTAVLLWLGGAVWWHFLTPLPLVIPGFIAAIVTSQTRMNRIKDFLDHGTMAYQAEQSLKTISSGGLMGKGLGRGVFKYGHLPEDTTDFIFSVVCEETGFIGALVVVALFVLFTVIGLTAVMRCQDRFGRLLGLGIVLCISIQAVINIGVVTVVLPTKGIPLPLISAGGTSMLLTATAMGILLSILRHNEAQLNPANAGVFLQRD